MKVKPKVWLTAAAAAVILVVSVLVLTNSSVPINKESNSSIPMTETREILLIANENVLRIAPDNDLQPGGVFYDSMTFNGTIPGPPIFVNQGDTVRLGIQTKVLFCNHSNCYSW